MRGVTMQFEMLVLVFSGQSRSFGSRSSGRYQHIQVKSGTKGVISAPNPHILNCLVSSAAVETVFVVPWSIWP